LGGSIDAPDSGGTMGSAGVDGSIDAPDSGGTMGSAGAAGSDGAAASGGVDGGSAYVVAMVQAAKAQAVDLTQADIVELVTSAVTQAGGIDFIKDGQTVVLKPNIVTVYLNYAKTKTMEQTVNGVSTDWRVAKAVADLVRAKNPTGKILIMEGSTIPAATAFSLMGYTAANFGASVDEFIGFEGASCADRSTDSLEERTAPSGARIWVNKRYVNADVVISLPTLKTHFTAGITGGVKNLGIGTTPVGQYSAALDGGTSQDCTRGQTAAFIDHTSAETLGQFIHDNYSIRPADFVVMDGLQGLQNGPASIWAGTNYANDKMNMRLILAGTNAVAVDTIEALVMQCDPTKVPHLTKLAADGFGTTDVSQITVAGKQVREVSKPFASALTAICPGR
jgi:uncharacterized protein (DUF362 family)